MRMFGSRPDRILLSMVLGLLAGCPTVPARGQDQPRNPAADLKAVAAIAACRPFLEDSPDPRTDPGTIGRFFTPDIYARLRGNEFFGYSHDEGYTPPAEKTVRLRLVRTLPALRRYERPLLYALIAGAVRAGLQPAPESPAEIGVCLLGVDTRSRPGQTGILLEAYIENTRIGKARFLRCAFGKPTLEEALLAAAEFLMRLATK